MKKIITLLILYFLIFFTGCQKQELTIYGDNSIFLNEVITLTHNYKGSREVEWNSLNKNIATVNDGIVTPISSGYVTISLKVGKSVATFNIEILSFDIDIEGLDTIIMGGSCTYKVVFNEYVDQSILDSIVIKWSLEDYTCATIYENGRLSPKQPGETIVIANVNGQIISKKVTILTHKLPGISIVGDEYIVVGEEKNIEIKYTNIYNLDLGDLIIEIDNEQVLSFTSYDPYIISGNKSGIATIKAYFSNYPYVYATLTIKVIE